MLPESWLDQRTWLLVWTVLHGWEILLFLHHLPWSIYCYIPNGCPQSWTWYIHWGGQWPEEWGGIHFYFSWSICLWVGSLVLVIFSCSFSLQRRNWLHRVIWILGSSLFWGVPVQIYAFHPSLPEWVGVVLLGGCLVLLAVVLWHGPIQSIREVFRILLC